MCPPIECVPSWNVSLFLELYKLVPIVIFVAQLTNQRAYSLCCNLIYSHIPKYRVNSYSPKETLWIYSDSLTFIAALRNPTAHTVLLWSCSLTEIFQGESLLLRERTIGM